MTAANKTLERIERHVYDGRRFLGFFHTRQTGNGFDALDAEGRFLGHFDTTDAATLAVIFSAKQPARAA